MAFAFIGLVIIFCSGIILLKEEEADSRKAKAVAVKPFEQGRKETGAAEKLPDAPKKQIQPLPPKPPEKKPFGVVRRIKGRPLGISPDFKVYAAAVFPVRRGSPEYESAILKIIDLGTGQELPSPKWDKNWGYPHAAAICQDTIAIAAAWPGSDPKDVRVFSRMTGELQQHFTAGSISSNIYSRFSNGMWFTEDGKFLAFVENTHRYTAKYRLVLRDVAKKITVDTLELGNFLYLRGTGKQLLTGVSAESGSFIQIFTVEVSAGKLVKRIRSKDYRKIEGLVKDSVLCAFSPVGNLIACTFPNEDDIILCDVGNGKIVRKLEGHLDTVSIVAFSPNGEIVASAAKDKTIRFWKVKQGKEIHIIKDPPIAPLEMIFSTDGENIAIVGLAGDAEIWSVDLK